MVTYIFQMLVPLWLQSKKELVYIQVNSDISLIWMSKSYEPCFDKILSYIYSLDGELYASFLRFWLHQPNVFLKVSHCVL
jgi:hypothetical protein